MNECDIQYNVNNFVLNENDDSYNFRKVCDFFSTWDLLVDKKWSKVKRNLKKKKITFINIRNISMYIDLI